MGAKLEQGSCSKLNEPLLPAPYTCTHPSSSCNSNSTNAERIKQTLGLVPPVENHTGTSDDNGVIVATEFDCRPETRSRDVTLDQHSPTYDLGIGGWKVATFLLGAHSLQSLATSGCTVNLVIFLVDKLEEENASAANIVTNWIGTSFLISIIGASIGDSSMGHMWTSVMYHIVFIVGLITFTISGSIIANEQTTQMSSYQLAIFYISLYIMGIGSASATPNIVSLGVEQFDSPRQKSVFVTIYIASTNVGLLLATACISYVQNQGNWALGFKMSAGAGIISLLLLLLGIARVRNSRRNVVNPLVRIVDVVMKKVTRRNKGLHPSTLIEVEQVNSILRLLPFWICSILVCSVTAQKSTLFVLQGATMDNTIGLKFKVPSSSMGLFSFLSVVIGAPLYSWLVAPYMLRKRKKELSPIERMGIGLLMAISAFFVAAIVESQRLRIAHMTNINSLGLANDEELVPMSILWLVPQYVLEGLTIVFFGCGNLDFNYTYSPVGMRSLATAIFLSGMALGSFSSTLIVQIVTSFTGWIPSDLNFGHLDYFYWLLDGILFLTLALFVVFSKWHHKTLSSPTELR